MSERHERPDVEVPIAGLFYRGVSAWARSLVGTYYRVDVRGRSFPARSPVILVANHSNGLADGGLLMYVTGRPLRFLVKFKLLSMPVLGRIIRRIGAVPIYRKKDNVDTALNKDSFAAVYAALALHEVIAVFPEGSSGSAPHLRELKTGAARLALGAEAENGFGLGVLIQPIGFVYAARDRFRSRATVVIGEPLRAADLRASYEADPYEASRELTRRVDERLRAITVDLAEWRERPLVDLAERLAPGADRSAPERQAELARGLSWLRAHRPSRARELAGRVRELSSALHEARLGPAGEELPSIDRPAGPGRRALRLGRALLVAPLLAIGCLAWCPPALLARGIGLAARPTPDKLVTTQLLAAFVLFPAWFALCVTLVHRAAGAGTALLAAGALALVAALLVWIWHRRAELLEPLRAPFEGSRTLGDLEPRVAEVQRELARLERLTLRLRRRSGTA